MALRRPYSPYAGLPPGAVIDDGGMGNAGSGGPPWVNGPVSQNVPSGPKVRNVIRAPVTPDYGALISADPAFIQLKATIAAEEAAARSAMLTGTNQAVINFGDASGTGVDAATTAAASSNPYSTLHQLLTAHETALRTIPNQLAGRGALFSGETGYELGQEGQAYGQKQYDTRQQLLSYLSGLQAAFASQQNADQGTLATGAQTAEANAIASYPATQGYTGTANWDPATGTYVDPLGGRYDTNGNPL